MVRRFFELWRDGRDGRNEKDDDDIDKEWRVRRERMWELVISHVVIWKVRRREHFVKGVKSRV